MNCPNCTKEMDATTLHAHLGASVTIDVCAPCQAFWFDKFESLQLSPGATLQLMKVIGEHSSPDKPSWLTAGRIRCDSNLLGSLSDIYSSSSVLPDGRTSVIAGEIAPPVPDGAGFPPPVFTLFNRY